MTIPSEPAASLDERAATYRTIADALHWLQAQAGAPPSLAALAAHCGLSEFHLQRLFSRWAGVSPKRFLQHLARERARAALLGGDNLLEASFAAGLSGPGRLHDLMVSCEAASPGEIKSGGAGLRIVWGLAMTPFGAALLAQGGRGLMKLSFIESGGVETGDMARSGIESGSIAGGSMEAGSGEGGGCEVGGMDIRNMDSRRMAAGHAASPALRELQQAWPAAALQRDDAAAQAIAARIFAAYRQPEPLPLFLKGTQFQLRVWEALLRIPEGRLVTYGRLAASLGQPGASRAVGSAVGANPVALLIPCHRVIRASGALGGYRWGEARKQLLVTAEIARHAPEGVEPVTN